MGPCAYELYIPVFPAELGGAVGFEHGHLARFQGLGGVLRHGEGVADDDKVNVFAFAAVQHLVAHPSPNDIAFEAECICFGANGFEQGAVEKGHVYTATLYVRKASFKEVFLSVLSLR